MSLSHATINCASQGCYAIITLHPTDEDRLRQTHERFYCPAGHSNYFPGKTKQEKRLDELERQLAAAESLRDRLVAQRDVCDDIVGELRRGLTVCPLGCGWHTPRRLSTWSLLFDSADERDARLARFFDRVYGDLREHLIHDHNATVKPVALLEAGDPA